MGILSTILGSGDVVSKGIDLIDSFHTSKTEEIEAKTNAKIAYLKAYHPYKLAQRILMLMFASTFLVSFFICLGFTLAYIFGLAVVAEGIDPIDEILDLLSAFYIGPIMLAIVGFYFGGGFTEGIIERLGESKKVASN